MRPTSYPLAPAVLSLEQKAAYYQMRADLMRDRAPVDTFERMLVDQAALAWCRLQSSQANYFRLLNFHTHEQSVIHDCSAGESGKAIPWPSLAMKTARGSNSPCETYAIRRTPGIALPANWTAVKPIATSAPIDKLSSLKLPLKPK